MQQNQIAANFVADVDSALDYFENAVTVADIDASKYPIIIHRRLTDEINRLKPKVEEESSQPSRVWIWWSLLAASLVLEGRKPISKDAVRDKGIEAYRELVFLEACAAEYLRQHLDTYLLVHKGYKTALRAVRAHLVEKLKQYRAAAYGTTH